MALHTYAPYGAISDLFDADKFFNRTFRVRPEDTKYPPYNIIALDKNQATIELAVAGFEEDELSIEVIDRNLVIKGSTKTNEGNDSHVYVRRGIATRDFRLVFNLVDNTIVKAAGYRNGILSISLETVVPEESKPKKIPINKGTKHSPLGYTSRFKCPNEDR